LPTKLEANAVAPEYKPMHAQQFLVLAGEGYPGFGAELFSTFAASGIAVRDEDFQLVVAIVLYCRILSIWLQRSGRQRASFLLFVPG
jgi:hypothetical protein